ncbi:MAG: HAMP domain-containing histidine kinase [Bdellovibrionales bacterium]|nr:HAMP domain-containing histidine kinase [Bdellovibrionales bacterium]
MGSIRFRLFLLLTLFTGTTLVLAAVSVHSARDFRDGRQQLETSYMIRDEIQDLSSIKGDSEAFRKLQTVRAQLTPYRRMDEFSKLLQAVSENNPRMLRERHQVFLKNEAEFQRYTRQHLDYLEKRLTYFALLALATLLLGFVALQLFVNRSVIRPIRDLSRKMVDFVNDRYTYQFSVPAPDEIGHMQATFNSLAQRVISNMEQLRTLDQAKSEFLSIASHELRTPLTSIKGSLSLMRSGIVGKMNDMADNLLTIAENETDRLIRLINDILDLAKIEARKLPLHQEWHSLNNLVTVSLQSLQGLAGQADVLLQCEAMPPVNVYMDNDRIQQVLTNLLSNAIKFSPKGKPVVVSCQVNERNELLIEVRDAGRGIDPQDQEAIFQKFRQATNAKNPLVKGTGLGLAIARALVEQHGGEIGVRSVPGEGSTFYFTLPEWKYALANKVEVAA